MPKSFKAILFIIQCIILMMKKSIILAAFATITLVACNNKSKEENHDHNADGSHPNTESTHQHEDGSVHTDHAEETTQETFKVGQENVSKKDTIKKEEAHDHSDPNHKH